MGWWSTTERASHLRHHDFVVLYRLSFTNISYNQWLQIFFFFCMSGRTGADVSTSPAIHQLSIWWWVFIVYPIRKLVLRENYAWGAGTSRKWFDMSWPPASTRLYTLLHKIAVSGKLLSPPAFRLGARKDRRRGVASPLTRFPSSKIYSLWQAQ